MNTLVGRNYRFHAAHRNEELDDKCHNIHGHTYHIEVFFLAPHINENTGVSILFDDIDKEINPIIKQLDHGLMVHDKDPLLEWLLQFNFAMGKIDKSTIKLVKFNFPTSAENLSRFLFEKFEQVTGLEIKKLSFKETESSTIIIEK